MKLELVALFKISLTDIPVFSILICNKLTKSHIRILAHSHNSLITEFVQFAFLNVSFFLFGTKNCNPHDFTKSLQIAATPYEATIQDFKTHFV